NPQLTSLTPEQMAEFLRAEKETKELMPKLARLIDSHHVGHTAVLSCLASLTGLVLARHPEPMRANMFNGFQQAVRDIAFNEQTLHAGPLWVPPPSKP